MRDEIYNLIAKVENKYGEDSDEAADVNDSLSMIASETNNLRDKLRDLLDSSPIKQTKG
jgi:hypothetical protein